MAILHMVEVRPDLSELLRFLRGQTLEIGEHDEDLGYGVHAWMRAAFGQAAPQPWRLLFGRGRPVRILGYSAEDAKTLRARLGDFAEPSVFAVCRDESDVSSRPMPDWQPGRRLRFELQCCPVGRKSNNGVEKDLFLIRAEAGHKVVSREEVYGTWVQEHIERTGAAKITGLELTGFRLVEQTRQTQPTSPDRRKKRRLVRPQVIFQGQLEIGDPYAFTTLLAHGVGRHRAFGYGMMLLRPPT